MERVGPTVEDRGRGGKGERSVVKEKYQELRGEDERVWKEGRVVARSIDFLDYQRLKLRT
jgi:hypothetical protein